MAAQQLEVLRAHRPHGPYYLGGHCNGGLVAPNLFPLLMEQGEQVGRLILVDSSASNLGFRRLHRAVQTVQRLGRGHTEELFRQLRALGVTLGPLSPRQRAAYLAGHTARVPSVLLKVIRSDRTEVGSEPEPLAGATWAVSLREDYLDLDRFYFPTPLPVPLELVWPLGDPEAADEALAWWRRISPQVELTTIPGTHVSCRIEHVDAYAAALRAGLER